MEFHFFGREMITLLAPIDGPTFFLPFELLLYYDIGYMCSPTVGAMYGNPLDVRQQRGKSTSLLSLLCNLKSL